MGAQCTKLITTRYVMYFSRKISKVGGRLPQWRDENPQDRDEKSRERDEIPVERDETSRQESLKEFADDYNPYWQKKRKSIQDDVKLRVIEAGSKAVFPRRRKSVFLMT